MCTLKICWLLAAMGPGAGLYDAAWAQQASTYAFVPLLANRDVFPAHGEQTASVLTTPAFVMQPGEMRRVIGQLDVRIPSGHGNPEVGNSVNCFDQGGHQVANAGSGTNYTGNGHAYQWNASLLLVAPPQNPAENYFCQIWTYASSNDTGYRMTVLAPTPGQKTYGTWLQFSAGNEPGALALSHSIDICHTDGTGTCEYAGGPARLHNANAIDIFSGDVAPPVVFTATNDATTIDGITTFQITTCTHGTGSCPANERGDSGVYDGKGETWLELDQLNPDGSVCQANRAYSEVPGSQAVVSEAYDISDAQHHRPLYHHLSAPVSQLCGGSRRFAVDLRVQWTGGNGVKIDGGWANVINSVRARTATVPNVVGFTQAQAEAAIRAAGFYGSAPNNVAATAAPGTVLAQNAPAGTIEPAGSPVQVTVSLGQVIVPNVLGDPAAAGEQAIKQAGLALVMAPPIDTCAAPSTVKSESPPGGATVAPGSPVTLQVTACTR